MRLILIVSMLAIAWPRYTHAAATVYFNALNHPVARQAWQTDAGNYTTIDFTGFTDNTLITNQYEPLGILFTDGTDRIFHSATAMPNDGAGLYGVSDTIHIQFANHTYSLAVDFPGGIQIQLYNNGQLVFSSPDVFAFNPGGFLGLISDTPFDAAVILDPAGGVFIDDLFFGPPIPAAPAAAIFALAALFPTSRRRRS